MSIGYCMKHDRAEIAAPDFLSIHLECYAYVKLYPQINLTQSRAPFCPSNRAAVPTR
jgi:hypothetical protein